MADGPVWDTVAVLAGGGIFRAVIDGRTMEIRSQENGYYGLVYDKDAPLNGTTATPVATADTRAAAEDRAIGHATGRGRRTP